MIWGRYFDFGAAELAPDMIAALVCREMKWTWHEYLDTPQRFIDIVVKLLQAESAYLKKKK